MSAYFSFIISFLLGFLVINFIFRNTSLNFFLKFFLSVGTGLGLSGQITFFTFLVFGRHTQAVIVLIHLILIALFIFIHFFRAPKSFKFTLRTISFMNICYGLFFIGLFTLSYTLAYSHPFGEWDAWALWNMKTRFLVLGGLEWKNIFELHWHTQPDYPLLLPFMNVWHWSISQAHLFYIGLLTAVIFTTSTAGLLFGGLAHQIDKKIAFFCACMLFFLPLYQFIGTSQYVDIILAYYLLAALISVVGMFKEKSKRYALFLGMNLGFIAFIKNDGIAIDIILLMLILFYLLKNPWTKKERIKLSSFLAIGLITTGLAPFIFKIFLAPPNHDILNFSSLGGFHFLNWDGFYLIMKAWLKEIFDREWCYVWLVVLGAGIVSFRKNLSIEKKVLLNFFLFYSLSILVIYLTTINFDLSWRLSRTLSRIFFYLLPSALYVVNYLYWNRREIPAK